jgi:hypothetical protein
MRLSLLTRGAHERARAYARQQLGSARFKSDDKQQAVSSPSFADLC